MALELAAVSDLVLALLNCDAIKVADLLEWIVGLADCAEKPLEQHTEGSIVLFLVTPGSMGRKLLAHASLVADARQSEAETETKVEALNIATRDLAGPCCTKALDEAVKILNGINDLQKDGNNKKTFHRDSRTPCAKWRASCGSRARTWSSPTPVRC